MKDEQKPNEQLINELEELRLRVAELGKIETEHRRAEEALRESEDKYRSLYYRMNEGVAFHEIIYDKSDRPVDYVTLDVNPAYESILGLKKKEVIGRKASQLYGTSEPLYIETYAKVAVSGQPVSFETYFPPMAKHFSISVFSPGNGKFATLFSDMTERKRVEEEVRKHRNHLEKLVKKRAAELENRNEQLKKGNQSQHK